VKEELDKGHPECNVIYAQFMKREDRAMYQLRRKAQNEKHQFGKGPEGT
jgi:hypothetical protein